MVLATKLSVLIRKLVRESGLAALERLPTGDRFRQILERERARADRTGDPLSLVTFTAPHPSKDQETAAGLVAILRWRLRATDEVGRLDDRQLCVLLPDTSPWGAWKVADDICSRLPVDVPAPVCVVYTYPSALPPDRATPIPNGADPAAARGVHALEALFVQPMPLWKRSLDVAGALVGIVVLAPLFAGIALAVKATSPGPVLFRQQRSGRGGKPFWMYKFRSMTVDAEARKPDLLARNEQDGPAFKVRDDPRVTPLGRFLRRTSLDELPQLWNVLRGDMSLVGPRPLPCEESAACAGWQQRRLDVTPGLTCIWQVQGRSTVSFASWVRMDVQYIRSLSPGHDLKLLLLTVPAVLLGRGAH